MELKVKFFRLAAVLLGGFFVAQTVSAAGFQSNWSSCTMSTAIVNEQADGSCVGAAAIVSNPADGSYDFVITTNADGSQTIVAPGGANFLVPAGSTLVGTVLTTSDGNSIDLATLDTDTDTFVVIAADGTVTNADGTTGTDLASQAELDAHVAADLDTDPSNELYDDSAVVADVAANAASIAAHLAADLDTDATNEVNTAAAAAINAGNIQITITDGAGDQVATLALAAIVAAIISADAGNTLVVGTDGLLMAP